jgi:hypothetical protein
MGIHELWLNIPSPKTPEAQDWTPKSAGDRKAHSCLLRGDDIEGIKTNMYRYQVVRFILIVLYRVEVVLTIQRSVNRMIQMENNPKQLINPQLTELIECGRPGKSKYYVNLANFDIQVRPVPYSLPRGGILYIESLFVVCLGADG